MGLLFAPKRKLPSREAGAVVVDQQALWDEVAQDETQEGR